MKNRSINRLLEWSYHYRWWAAAATVTLVLAAQFAGMSNVLSFSQKVDSLRAEATGLPRLFDMRTDIWFDPADDGLEAYRDLEDQFIAEDTVVVAFEETDDEWGAFGEQALSTVGELTREIEQVPYVRSVRSLTSSPWIRWGEAAPGEDGLVVSDLFEDSVAGATPEQRLERMIAVLGAERAARLAGESAVRSIIGQGADFAEFAGEPRFINAIVSEDGRTAGIQVQVLRQKPTREALASTFDSPTRAEVGGALATIESQTQAVQAIKSILAKYDRYDMHIAGVPVLEQHFPEVGTSDMAYLALMFVAIALALSFVYRRISGVVLPLLVVFLSIVGMNGLVWYAGDLVNNLTATAPIVMVAVGIADAVHLVTAYFTLRPEHATRRELIIEVIRRNAVPVLLTSVTTAAAFFSLVVSPITPVRQFGYTAGVGTVIAYLLSMTLIPAALSLIPLAHSTRAASASVDSEGLQTPPTERRGWTDRLLDVVLPNKRLVLAASAGLLVLSTVGVHQLQVESDLRVMFPADDPVTSDLRWLERKLGGAGDLDLVFYGPPNHEPVDQTESRQVEIQRLRAQSLKHALSDDEAKQLEALAAKEHEYQRGRIAATSEFLQQVDAFERRLREEAADSNSPLAVLTSFDSGLSVLRRIHEVQNQNQASYYRVPTIDDVPEAARKPIVSIDEVTEEVSFIPAQTASTLASQYYLQYENGARPAENLSPLVTQDRRGFRIAARVAGRPSAELIAAYDRIRDIARSEFPQLTGTPEQVQSGEALSTMRLTGKHYLFITMLERFTATLLKSMLIAALVITALIALVFRSVSLGLLSIVPNVLPLVIPLGLLGVLGIALDGPAVIVATVALGVCVDDTIHLFSKFSDARRAGASMEDALRMALRKVGNALSWTTLVLVLGFSVMSLSAFRPNMMIGALGAVMVLLAWVADLVVTPVLLTLIEKRQTEKLPQSVREVTA